MGGGSGIPPPGEPMTIYAFLKSLVLFSTPGKSCLSFRFFQLTVAEGALRKYYSLISALLHLPPFAVFALFGTFDAADSLAAKRHKFTRVRMETDLPSESSPHLFGQKLCNWFLLLCISLSFLLSILANRIAYRNRCTKFGAPHN